MKENLNFTALRSEYSDQFDLGNGLTAYILRPGTEDKAVINIYDGTAVVLTLTGYGIDIFDWWGWGAG